jgi:GNAT superfamily N-acetyltransferase
VTDAQEHRDHMKQTTITPRIATRDDIPGISAAVTRAFMDYPLMVYMVPAADKRAAKLLDYHELFLSKLWPAEDHGIVFTTDGHAGASVWAKPGHWKLPTATVLRLLPGMLRIFGFRTLLRTVRILTAFEKRHPKDDTHWHLQLLGTDPPMQRKGVGAALMAEVLETCDREGRGAYLETQKIENVAYYRRHGFEVTQEIQLGRRGPRGWLMWRDPR